MIISLLARSNLDLGYKIKKVRIGKEVENNTFIGIYPHMSEYNDEVAFVGLWPMASLSCIAKRRKILCFELLCISST